MNMYKKIKYGMMIFTVWCFCSCSDYLDVIPDNMPVIDHAFNNRTMAERYLFTCYSYLPNPSDPSNYPGIMAGCETWISLMVSGLTRFTGAGANDTFAWNIARGLQNANNPLLNYWDGGNGGTNLFVALRDCNIFLENIHKAVDLQEYERIKWIAEVKFLKAYYHFFLLRSYGPIPIIDQNIPVSSSVEEVRTFREPVEKVSDYIVSLIDEAAEDLDLYIEVETTDMGRATKPMALALKAKLLTLMASPMFNGNPYYLDMIDKRGINLFPVTPDPAKWQKAAVAIKEAIDCAHEAGNKLYYYEGFYPISDDTKAKLNIRGSVTERWNRELIWGSTKSSDRIQRVSILRTSALQMEIHSMLSPTLDVAERFYSKNGVPIEEDMDYDYDNRYQTSIVSAEDRYLMRQGFETANLHFNREPRFYATLFFDGCAFFGNGRTSDDPGTMPYAQMKKTQPGGQYADCYSITGYYPQKLVNISSVAQETGDWIPYRYAFPFIRLADLYLMYAEALNETQATPTDEVFYWIDEVRKRASLDGVKESWTLHSIRPEKFATQSGMREIIHRERLIELTCEGEHYWDLLRWKEAENVMSRPIRGWNISGEDTGEYYVIKTIENPKFGVKDYLTPIMQGSLDINPNLIQNPGW